MTVTLAKIIWLIGVIAWYLIRRPYDRRARKVPVARTTHRDRDRILLLIAFTGLGIVPLAYAVTGFPRFADYPFVPVLAWCGAAIFAAAIWLFRRSHHDLGRNWSVTLEVRERHALVTAGVYRLIRHPMYASFWLWAIAQALLLPNWIAGPAGLFGVGILFFLRLPQEERLMLETFGDQYKDYASRTARVVPWLY
jgi:protein-S-isoprenylcysteine O-methyltransferase Ste14